MQIRSTAGLGRRIRSCECYICLANTTRSTTLDHKMASVGLACAPDSKQGRVVSPDDVSDLAVFLNDLAAGWELFLGLLKVSRSVRSRIKQEHAHSPNYSQICLLDGLEHWVISQEHPTFESIVEVLNSTPIDNKALAVKISTHWGIHDQGEQEELNTTAQRYDVFLSFAEEDEEFAEEMKHKFVNDAELEVAVASDVIAGKIFHQEIADIIMERCRKIVIILSPYYLKSEWCLYEANHALYKSPSAKKHCLIPVLYRQCEIPSFLDAIVPAHYPNHSNGLTDLQGFWTKLYKSVKPS